MEKKKLQLQDIIREEECTWKPKKNIKERKKFDKRRFIFHHIEIKENRGTSKKTSSSFQSQKKNGKECLSQKKEITQKMFVI